MTVDGAADQRVFEFAHTAFIISANVDVPSVLSSELHRSAGIYDEVLLVVGERTRAALTSAPPRDFELG